MAGKMNRTMRLLVENTARKVTEQFLLKIGFLTDNDDGELNSLGDLIRRVATLEEVDKLRQEAYEAHVLETYMPTTGLISEDKMDIFKHNTELATVAAVNSVIDSMDVGGNTLTITLNSESCGFIPGNVHLDSIIDIEVQAPGKDIPLSHFDLSYDADTDQTAVHGYINFEGDIRGQVILIHVINDIKLKPIEIHKVVK